MFGAYYLTIVMDGAKGEGAIFRRLDEVEAAYEAGDVALHAKITLRRGPDGFPFSFHGRRHEANEAEEPEAFETTPGRMFFNAALPRDFGYVNDVVGRRATSIGSIVEQLASHYPKAIVAESLDAIKELGFRFATRSGLTISIDDVKTPPEKREILDRYEKEAEQRRGAVQAGHHHRRRAAPEGDRDLDLGQLRGRAGDGSDPRDDQVQPARHDGRLRRPREPPAGPPDRRHEGPRLEPPWRDDPAADRLLLPRGTLGPRVLHLDPRRPQGSRRHGAAYR